MTTVHPQSKPKSKPISVAGVPLRRRDRRDVGVGLSGDTCRVGQLFAV
jgi:hypothetical protein